MSSFQISPHFQIPGAERAGVSCTYLQGAVQREGCGWGVSGAKLPQSNMEGMLFFLQEYKSTVLKLLSSDIQSPVCLPIPPLGTGHKNVVLPEHPQKCKPGRDLQDRGRERHRHSIRIPRTDQDSLSKYSTEHTSAPKIWHRH